ncbi:hypothetical protein [Bacillus halotolerans]|uniref:hypothetical protein n=1 Tax=Bacillus halotolerans TaxID=260554 RepID=UPI002DBC74A2|nr:hypothetical protein [Bacillus halotolerans]MEC1664506.1 hypothetical protein [Bacillus halotolerans]
MKRKYMSEFGLHTYSSYLTICYPNDIGNLNMQNGINNHIYMITLIPKLAIDKDSLQVFEDHLSLRIKVKTEEDNYVETLEFSLGPINHKEFKYEVDKPGKTFTVITKDGAILQQRVLFLYLDYLENTYNSGKLDTEILYIGQSYGSNGERTAIDRLKSHSTLQKIQSELLFEGAERDLALLLLEFTPKLLSSFDGRTQNYEKSPEEDINHLQEVVGNPPLKLNKQIINITEAALINYFKPYYNDKFKDNFPDVEHKGYKQYYDLDYNAVSVELDPDSINLRLYSKERSYKIFESIKYSLHPENIRKSMFDIFLE